MIGVSQIEPNVILDTDIYAISEIIINNNFANDMFSRGFDLALLKLTKPVNATSTIGFVCLPTSTFEFDKIFNKLVVAVGWGSTDGKNSYTSISSSLQQTTFIAKNSDAGSICGGVSYNSSSIYCVLDSNSNRGSNVCFGEFVWYECFFSATVNILLSMNITFEVSIINIF